MSRVPCLYEVLENLGQGRQGESVIFLGEGAMAVDKNDSVLSYEEARKQRVEENKRRMEELGLMELSKDLKQKNLTKKPALKRKIYSQDDAESRRSSRVAAKPAVNYRDQLDLLPGMRSRVGGRDRQGLPRRFLSDQARVVAVEAAEEVFKDIKNPAFVKPMLHSHISSGFWLGLPHHFCRKHMPLEDERFTLVDDKEEESECLYLAHKSGFSGGWRGFSLDHELVDGDCCIFELVRPLRFKVHIFRCEEEGGWGEEADGKVEGKESTTEKKVSKAVSKKKAPKKSSKSSPKDGQMEIDEDDDFSKKLAKKEDAGISRASRAARRNSLKGEEVGQEGDTTGRKDGEELKVKEVKTKKGTDLIELEDDDDDDGEKVAGVDVRKSGGVRRTNETGSGEGRASRKSSRRFSPP